MEDYYLRGTTNRHKANLFLAGVIIAIMLVAQLISWVFELGWFDGV